MKEIKKTILDWKEYAQVIREAASGGMVLLKNDRNTLPIKKGEKVSVFGRIQLEGYHTGAGSGGMVNVPYNVSIISGLRNSGIALVNEELLSVYESWIADHPFDNGEGWAHEPFCQEEMPLTEEIVRKAAENSGLALVVIGRLAGEDRDVEEKPGSWYLTSGEEEMLSQVTSAFDRVAVLLNTGGIMDMSWMDKYDPSAVMYIWQGGMEMGNAAADVLCGKVSPSGHLTDTIAYLLEDYPSHENFGDPLKNIYAEDIYVGYRYFETAAADRVRYPFGSGLSYTSFEISPLEEAVVTEDGIRVSVKVKNTGEHRGREVVQVYVDLPRGRLGKPKRVLAGFAKTPELEPGESFDCHVSIDPATFASYDDSGITGERGCFLLEEGSYGIYAGDNIRDVVSVGSFEEKQLRVLARLDSACMPLEAFDRLSYDHEKGCLVREKTPLRDYEIKDRIESERDRLDREMDIRYTGDAGLKLSDVKEGRCSLKEFMSQLTDDDLMILTRAEGLYSPRATDGTVGAFGGMSDRLESMGIPVVCITDGPSGIRRDDGSMAFSIPCGTLLACSFDTQMTERLYGYVGTEMKLNCVDSLLGPGINIHRHPQNGRNFEYFSEDPYLTGIMGSAVLKGLGSAGVTGTVKHFCANNQEKSRTKINSVVSERALREIYLKPFELTVRLGGACCFMSTYGALNGVWTGGSFDLITTVLRHQWGFEGVVMTDWWAGINDELKEGSAPSLKDAGSMVRAQNDLYAIHGNSERNTGGDNLAQCLEDGRLKRTELVRSAANILGFILKFSLTDPRQSVEEKNRPEYDGKDRNRKADIQLQSQPV